MVQDSRFSLPGERGIVVVGLGRTFETRETRIFTVKATGSLRQDGIRPGERWNGVGRGKWRRVFSGSNGLKEGRRWLTRWSGRRLMVEGEELGGLGGKRRSSQCSEEDGFGFVSTASTGEWRKSPLARCGPPSPRTQARHFTQQQQQSRTQHNTTQLAAPGTTSMRHTVESCSRLGTRLFLVSFPFFPFPLLRFQGSFLEGRYPNMYRGTTYL